MPFQKHSVFCSPESPEQRTWRYLSLTKFISMLEDRALYFCNLDILAKSDPFEGALTKPNYNHRSWISANDLSIDERVRIGLTAGMSDEETSQRLRAAIASRERRIQLSFCNRRAFYVSCWHMSDDESAAMWSVYAGREEGIAIQSNYNRMITSLASALQTFYAGAVQYINYQEVRMDDENGFAPALCKRKSYDFEHELRMLHWDQSITHTLSNEQPVGFRAPEEIEKMPVSSGVIIPCDINILIEKVYVSPMASGWFLQLVESLVSRYNLDKKVRRSGLSDEPLR